MKTEAEFNNWLKRCMRCARRELWLTMVAKKMHMKPAVFSAYEQGRITLSVYQLYQFMHATGRDAEFMKQIFDDSLRNPIRPKSHVTDDE